VLFDAVNANGPYTLQVSAASCATAVPVIEGGENWSAVARDGRIDLLVGSNAPRCSLELFAADGRRLGAWQRACVRGEAWELPVDNRTARGAFCLRVSTPGGSQVIRIAR
jgi:hypothetical protein